MALSGVMPWLRELPSCTSSGGRRKAAAILLVLAVCQFLPGSTSPDPPRISSSCFLNWKRRTLSFPAFKVAVVVKEEQWRDGGPDWVGAHPRWLLANGIGSCCRGRLPVDSNQPPNLLVEWRPFLFLPALMPKGRQCIFSMKSMARCHGGFVAPSGAVPGVDEALFVWRMIWTRSRFPYASWGPLCKNQGLVCSFLFVMGPVVRSCVLLFCF